MIFGITSPRPEIEAKLIPLPGHTLGRCGIAYREDGRWGLHAGDAYFDRRIHFSENPPGLPLETAFQTDATARRSSLRQLQRLQQAHAKEVAIFCTHDQQEFANWTMARGKPDVVSSLGLAS